MTEKKPSPNNKFIETSRLLFSNKVNDKANYDTNIKPEAYETLVNAFGRKRLASLVVDEFFSYLPLQINGNQAKVLDLAAGTGVISEALHVKGYNVVAGDLSTNVLKFLKDKRPYVDTCQFDMNKQFPFKDESFNGSTTVFANRYITNTNLFLHEVFRVLTRSGVFVWPIFQNEEQLWKEMAGTNQAVAPAELKAKLQEIGFQKIEVVQPNKLTTAIRKILLPFYVPEFVVAMKQTDFPEATKLEISKKEATTIHFS